MWCRIQGQKSIVTTHPRQPSSLALTWNGVICIFRYMIFHLSVSSLSLFKYRSSFTDAHVSLQIINKYILPLKFLRVAGKIYPYEIALLLPWGSQTLSKFLLAEFNSFLQTLFGSWVTNTHAISLGLIASWNLIGMSFMSLSKLSTSVETRPTCWG